MRKTELQGKASRLSMSEVAAQRGELLVGDAAVAYSSLPIEIIRAKVDIANKTGTYTADRIGNKPLIGNYSYKPMSVKAKTGAAFLFKSLIPLNPDYLKAKSVEVPQYNIDRFSKSQLKVSLNDILSDEKSYSIEHKDDKLYLRPKASNINDDDFKNPNSVSSTVFIIDLKNGEKPSMSPAEKQKQLPGTLLQEFAEPRWWKPEYGDFKEAQHLLRPVEYQNNKLAEPQKFEVLGDPPMTGDIDPFWIVPAVTSFINKDASGRFAGAHEKINFNDVEDVRNFRKIFNNIVNALNKEILGSETQLEFNEQDIQSLDIEGFATPFEAATIYMINKLYGDKQMMLHGPESHNPGAPSEIGEILHVLPGGNIYLTRNEDELIKLALTKNFLVNFPIPIHPGWDLRTEKWGQVVQARMKIEKNMGNKGIVIKQPLNPLTIEAYRNTQKIEREKAQTVSTQSEKKSGVISSIVGIFKKSTTIAPSPPAPLNRTSSTTSMLNLLSPRSEGEKLSDYKEKLKSQQEGFKRQVQSHQSEQKSVAKSPRSSSISPTASTSSPKTDPVSNVDTEERSSRTPGGPK